MNGRRTFLPTSSTYRSPIQEKEFESLESVVKHYEEIMGRLKRLVTDTKLKSYHSVDPIRFHKLIEWVAFKKHNLKMMEEAWSSSYFWPFLETIEAANLAQNDPSQLIIRLSNTHSGTITVTRHGKLAHGVGENTRFEAQVKHKRCMVNDDGTLLLINENQNRGVSWQELIDYLLTRECCICLAEIVSPMDAVVLPCKHCFHKTCLQGYLSYLKRQGKENQCTACRFSFKKIKWSKTKDPRLVCASSTTSLQLLNIPITLSLSSPPNDIEQSNNNNNNNNNHNHNHNDKSECESTTHGKTKFRSEDGQIALYPAPKCYVSSSTQALQGLENNCNRSQSQSQSLREKSWPSQTLAITTSMPAPLYPAQK